MCAEVREMYIKNGLVVKIHKIDNLYLSLYIYNYVDCDHSGKPGIFTLGASALFRATRSIIYANAPNVSF